MNSWLKQLIKLEIINSPGERPSVIARRVGVSLQHVYLCYNELNINRSSKPSDCVG